MGVFTGLVFLQTDPNASGADDRGTRFIYFSRNFKYLSCRRIFYSSKSNFCWYQRSHIFIPVREVRRFLYKDLRSSEEFSFEIGSLTCMLLFRITLQKVF